MLLDGKTLSTFPRQPNSPKDRVEGTVQQHTPAQQAQKRRHLWWDRRPLQALKGSFLSHIDDSFAWCHLHKNESSWTTGSRPTQQVELGKRRQSQALLCNPAFQSPHLDTRPPLMSSDTLYVLFFAPEDQPDNPGKICCRTSNPPTGSSEQRQESMLSFPSDSDNAVLLGVCPLLALKRQDWILRSSFLSKMSGQTRQDHELKVPEDYNM